MHGRRTNDVLARKQAHLDPETCILDLGKIKTVIRQLQLHRNALRLILTIRHGLGAPWHHPALVWPPHLRDVHAAGRYSVAHVADAHGETPDGRAALWAPHQKGILGGPP